MRDWDNIRIFLGVCRHGSLAAAARALKVDETTVGRRVKVLEASLGTLLFDRTAQGLVLTEAAEAVRAAAEAAEDAVLSVRGSVVGSDTRPSGFVRVTATETLSSQFLIPALGGFHLRYPEIRLELFSGYVALDVARGEADIAVRALPPVGSHLVARRLGTVVLAVYAAPAYLAQHPVGHFEDGLAGHDLIDFSDLISPRPPGQPFLGASTAGGRLVFTGNSPLGLTVAAEAGLGVATLPCYLAARRPGLIRLWPDRSQRYDLLAVMRQEVKRSARIRAVVDYLARHFRAQQSLLEGS
ncbi:MAG: LysR family transcriptional regulator [Beijerinckiaceae bacterium]